MSEYAARFLMALVTCVGLLAFVFGGGWLMLSLFDWFGIWGVIGFVVIVASALTAAMPHGGPPPR